MVAEEAAPHRSMGGEDGCNFLREKLAKLEDNISCK